MITWSIKVEGSWSNFNSLFIWISSQVNQRNVPGIDSAYLAMDTEEGVEVVWNEVQFSERKNYKLQEVGNGEMMQPACC